MKYLFSVWEELSQRLKAAERIMLLSDFDGTLSPIADRPEQAFLPDATRLVLQELSRKPDIDIGIISGRSLRDLKERVGIENATYAGNHGLEIEGPTFNFVEPVAQNTRPVLGRLYQTLKHALSPFRGVIVEDKGLTLTVHYRMVDGNVIDDFKALFEQIAGGVRSLGRVRVTSGKKVHELRPAVSWDKGTAIDMLIDRQAKHSGSGNSLAIFLGDDVTDEDGFKVVQQNQGISVFVGRENQHSAAEYFLRSPDEVQEFLRWLIEVRSHPSVSVGNEID